MEDKEIIELYFARDEAAIVETASKYGHYLTSVVYRILRNTHDTEEIVNDTYYNAWRTIPPKRPNILKLYLARIARNSAIDKMEYKLAQKRNSDMDVLLSEVADILSAGFDLEAYCESRELGAWINTFLGTLDARSRAVFLARYWYTYSIREIADKMDLSENYVKNLLFRTRRKLRKFLEERGGTI